MYIQNKTLKIVFIDSFKTMIISAVNKCYV